MQDSSKAELYPSTFQLESEKSIFQLQELAQCNEETGSRRDSQEKLDHVLNFQHYICFFKSYCEDLLMYDLKDGKWKTVPIENIPSDISFYGKLFSPSSSGFLVFDTDNEYVFRIYKLTFENFSSENSNNQKTQPPLRITFSQIHTNNYRYKTYFSINVHDNFVYLFGGFESSKLCNTLSIFDLSILTICE